MSYKKNWFNAEETRSFRAIHLQITTHLEKSAIEMMRIALAIVFIWFGMLKVVGMSPAQQLVEKTIYWFPPKVFVPFLGFWEVAIGIGLLIKRLIPYTVILLLIHMVGTFLPMFILTGVCYDAFPYCPSLEGQYIIKNLVLIAGALTVAGKYKLES
jgi:uncharacterized membrane protein YkgB